MVFLTEEWFWRGTQSAIFYYISCTPWVEYKHKRKRRLEAERSRKEKQNNVIYTQPGIIKQPAPFQTNEDWAQEIVTGPGPPKGWQRDSLYYKYAKRNKTERADQSSPRSRGWTATSTASPPESELTAVNSSSSFHGQAQASPDLEDVVSDRTRPRASTSKAPETSRASPRSPQPFDGTDDIQVAPSRLSSAGTIGRTETAQSGSQARHYSVSNSSGDTGSKRASFDSSTSSEQPRRPPRPSMERRLSTAMDGFKETMRAALHPDRWNWRRYDRDDEILPSLNEKMKSMWGSMKVNVNALSEDAAAKLRQMETKDSQPVSDVKKWQRGTHPAVNELHPPIVSQLPYSREEAKWMLLPPASADVMMGRRRPDPFDDTKRRPLCVIGQPVQDVPPSPEIDSPHMSSDDESQESENDEWLPGWTHVQKPQRAYLWKQRMNSLPVVPMSSTQDLST